MSTRPPSEVEAQDAASPPRIAEIGLLRAKSTPRGRRTRAAPNDGAGFLSWAPFQIIVPRRTRSSGQISSPRNAWASSPSVASWRVRTSASSATSLSRRLGVPWTPALGRPPRPACQQAAAGRFETRPRGRRLPRHTDATAQTGEGGRRAVPGRAASRCRRERVRREPVPASSRTYPAVEMPPL
jgi:hypothetical protein